jgi:hypothetical protein
VSRKINAEKRTAFTKPARLFSFHRKQIVSASKAPETTAPRKIERMQLQEGDSEPAVRLNISFRCVPCTKTEERLEFSNLIPA